MADIDVKLTPESLARLRKLAKEAEPTIRRHVNRGLRESGAVAVAASRGAVTGSIPPKADQRSAAQRLTLRAKRTRSGSGHTGLRAGIARGIGVSVTNRGIRIVSKDTALPANQKGMNRVYRLANFRHPVFGHKKTWANQHGTDFFYGPIRKTRTVMLAAVEDAMRSAAQELSK